jgi:hypothetical protein
VQAGWACDKLQIDKDDLMEKSLDMFRFADESGNAPTETMVKLRLENYEKRRRNKMRIVCEYIRLQGGNDMKMGDQKNTDNGPNRNNQLFKEFL